MAKFFIAGTNLFGGAASVSIEDELRLRALRLFRGETFTIRNGGTDYRCRADGLEGGFGTEILSETPVPEEPGRFCSLYAAFFKDDKMNAVVRQGTELGVSQFVVFPTAKSPGPGKAALLFALAGWRKIAADAAASAGRRIIPAITAVSDFSAAVSLASGAELPLFLNERETSRSIGEAIQTKPDAKTVSVFLGPEEGFEPDEAEEASKAMLSVTLGPRVLFCDTAAAAAVSAVMSASEHP